MWRRIFVIARREFLATVRRREFVLVTVGLPIFYVLLAAIVGGATASAVRSSIKDRSNARIIGFIDHSGLLSRPSLESAQGDLTGKVFETDEAGQAAVRDKKVRAFVIIPADFAKSGNVDVYGPDRGQSAFKEAKQSGEDYVPAIRRALLAGKVDTATADLTVRMVKSRTLSLNSKTGKFEEPDTFKEIGKFAVPYAFAMLLMLSVVLGSSYLLHGIVEEKENRVIEVLLSAATHEELLAGKVLGLGAVGLLQLGIWVSGAVLSIGVIASRFPQASALVAGPGLIATSIILFLLGYAVYASLMAGMGAMGTSWRESSQIAGVAVMPLMMPLMLMPVILEQPNGMIARVLSFFPLTAPIGMMLRVAAGGSSAGEVAITAVILMFTLWGVLRIAARLFRLSLLLYGQRPGVLMVLRYLFARTPAV